MNEKLLILESAWSQCGRSRLTDRRSTTAIYKAGIDATNLNDRLVVLTRPLIARNFATDIDNFLSLPANWKGINVIILSGHGYDKFLHEGEDGEIILTKSIEAYDGQISLLDINEIRYSMSRTILIFDCCNVGEHVHKVFKSTGCFGVIGFAKEAIWLDSTLFLQNVLMRFLIYGIFDMKHMKKDKVISIFTDMRKCGYKQLMDSLAVKYRFRK
ncbi:MAG: hypothetical protein WCQ99_07495 [Pseudomonadota bacterium]